MWQPGNLKIQCRSNWVTNFRFHYLWQPGNLKIQCRSNWVTNFRFHEYVYLYWVYFPSLPGLGHQRTVRLGYTPLDQQERRPGSNQVICSTWGYPISNRWGGPVVNLTGSPHEWSTSQWAWGASVYADTNRSVTSQGCEPMFCTRTDTWNNTR